MVAAAAIVVIREKLEHYDREGWVKFEALLDAAALEAARAACDERLRTGRDDPHWIMDVHIGDGGKWLMRLLTAPSIRNLVCAFCGEDAHLGSSQFFVKVPGEQSRAVGWHQDGLDSVQGDFDAAGLRDTDGHGPLSLWIPLDDVDENNGTLVVSPRLHTQGQLPVAPLSDEEAESGVGVGIDPRLIGANTERGHGPVPYRLRAGDGAAHHPFTPHMSARNRTDRVRRVLLLRLLPASLAAQYADVHTACVPVLGGDGASGRTA